MMNTVNNGMMSSSSNATTTTTTTTTTTANNQSLSSSALKTYFKTPEGRYKLHYEKTHPSGLLHFSHGKTVSQVTFAHLKDKPTQSTQTSTSGTGVASGVRSAAARILGTSNGRTLSFVGGNGSSKYASGTARNGSLSASSTSNTNGTLNFDGKGTYLVFNVGDTLFISDLNSQDKDPIKSILFSNSNPICHAFDPDAKDGHDLLIGLNSGEVYSVSLRQQLQDMGKKLVGLHHYNKDGIVNNSRCISLAWVPKGDGTFVVAHADGNMYVYEKSKDGVADSTFPPAKDQSQFCVSHTRTNKPPLEAPIIAVSSIPHKRWRGYESVTDVLGTLDHSQHRRKRGRRCGSEYTLMHLKKVGGTGEDGVPGILLLIDDGETVQIQ